LISLGIPKLVRFDVTPKLHFVAEVLGNERGDGEWAAGDEAALGADLVLWLFEGAVRLFIPTDAE
jgi:hypothetical protein